MSLVEAFKWAVGFTILTVSGIGFAAALSTKQHLFVAGFISIFALTVYTLLGRPDDEEA